LIEFLYLLLKYDENGAGRLAGLELSCERMGKKIVLCVFIMGFQGITEYKLEVGGLRASRVSVRHESWGNSEEFVRSERRMTDSQVSRYRREGVNRSLGA